MLHQTIMRGANLAGANLIGADTEGADFTNSDLSRVIGMARSLAD